MRKFQLEQYEVTESSGYPYGSGSLLTGPGISCDKDDARLSVQKTAACQSCV